MSKHSFVVGAIFAALLATSSVSKAATISAYYSIDGGSLNLVSDFNPAGDGFLGLISNAGGFSATLSATVTPASSSLLQSNVTSSHLGAASTLRIFFLSAGNEPAGNQQFLSGFTGNVGSATGTLATFYGNSTLASPFSSGANPISSTPYTGLFSTSFLQSVVVPSDFSLLAVYTINANGRVDTNTTVNISAVPGPIVGAGLPGLMMACAGLLALARRRRKAAV
jgi:hypothetical protein